MSEYFSNARDFALNQPNFSNIGRDQHVHHHHHTTTTTTTQSKIKSWIRETEEEEGEFEQYHEVKRADVELTDSICDSVPYNKRELWRKFDCVTKFFTGEITRGNAQSSGVMVVGYEGREAQEAWWEDFKRCTGLLSLDRAHLLAISKSKVPLLIFARALVPAAQFLNNVGLLGRAYFFTLSLQRLGCRPNDVWMDVQKGVLCRGPRGPDVGDFVQSFGLDVPSSMELLQDDVFLRFLAGLKSEEADRDVVHVLSQQLYDFSIDIQFNQPTVFSSLTNTPIASGVSRWYHYSDSPQTGFLLGNGQTRFAFNNPPTNIEFWLGSLARAWMSQAWSVFHALGVSLEDDPSQFKLIRRSLQVKLLLSSSKYKRQRRRQRPIFLFIRPLPSTPLLKSCTMTSLHYWSYNEDGQLPLPTNMCHYLGLPMALELVVFSWAPHSWSNDVYRRIRQYQVARSFDPSTTDFARSVGYDDPIYKPIQNDSDRFEEVDAMQVEDPAYSPPPPSPPVPYRYQILDESDYDTDDDYSDTDSNFSNFNAYSAFMYDKKYCGYNDDSESEVDELCIRFGGLVLD